jgi:hypothetical protein
MSVPADAAVQQEAEPVVGEIAEPKADPLDPLDEQVHRIGRTVADSASGEVRQQLGFPGRDGAPEPFEFRHAGGGAGMVKVCSRRRARSRSGAA